MPGRAQEGGPGGQAVKLEDLKPQAVVRGIPPDHAAGRSTTGLGPQELLASMTSGVDTGTGRQLRDGQEVRHATDL